MPRIWKYKHMLVCTGKFQSSGGQVIFYDKKGTWGHDNSSWKSIITLSYRSLTSHTLFSEIKRSGTRAQLDCAALKEHNRKRLLRLSIVRQQKSHYTCVSAWTFLHRTGDMICYIVTKIHSWVPESSGAWCIKQLCQKKDTKTKVLVKMSNKYKPKNPSPH